MNFPLKSLISKPGWPAMALCLSLFLWSMPSMLILKKVIALLILPAGIVWLVLATLAAWPGLKRGPRIAAAALFLIHTVAGNAWTGSWLLGKLEKPYVDLQAPAEPLDAILVLGGGTSGRPDGSAQLGPAGDRVITAARWYHAGKAKLLIASGLSVTDIGGKRSLADDTAAIWNELGIPDEAVIRFQSPRTTAEEIREFKKLVNERGWKRIGVCSSAWHLRRVETLCAKEGLSAIPVPADFLSTELPFNAMYAIPQARGFQNVQKALWEYLGGLAGG